MVSCVVGPVEMRLRDVDGTIDSADYPMTAAQLLERLGDGEIDLPAGDEPVAHVIGRCGTDSFASADEARLSVYGALPDGAIGRKGYSDRDPPMLGEAETVSF